ncbi:cytochrome P450 [Merismopedia glauca]|uniref:Cytochrome P450 n=1 Tax=Merismopedia glauca CCAP 1448/3 TaxID=1296344 RepID=A0A2T1C0I7_9CYAN|nr:cytochrome P450 [Merismopedia glauca]PSB01687.1 cytochrome P450 [Merismopedia glauca CCAP 1448/3]
MQTKIISPTNNLQKIPNGMPGSKLLKTLRAILQPIPYLESMRRRYGSIYQDTFYGFPPTVIVSEPQAIQEIFTADSQLFQSAASNKILEPLVGGNSLLLLDGKPHQQRRKLLMPQFHGERVKAYSQVISETTRKVMDRIPINQPFVARPTMQSISLEVILQAVFGLKEGKRYQEIKQILTEMLDVFNFPINASFFFFKNLQKDWGAWGKFMRQKEQLSKLLYTEIQERRQQDYAQGEDILSLLLSVKDEDGNSLSDVELKDELITMLFAGHETTAIALSWALYWIHYQPEVKEKLLAEINSLNLATLDPNEIVKLPYLNAVCSETLRICPVAFFTFSRILQQPMKLMNYQVPKGTGLAVSIYLVHHRPDIYLEPQQFRPERFLERQFSPYEYLPFGGGHRRCLGMVLALFEMKLVLTTILAHYSLNLLENKRLSPTRRGLVFAPPGGVKLSLN